ncbi:MAG TPA: aminotransferase class III-fold pyridoxal phosphate-dependent enzyme [Gammaproteobacteria bacterium]|nr:aminotransferase class III-fold pyridoxal phosphate-dependent enzyme [Gammaproteobacteria bacterium]
MNVTGQKLYGWEDCLSLDIDTVQDLYRNYVNPGQVDLIGSFGFGRILAKSASGLRIMTANGREILDFTGGIGVLNHGHNHPRILQARKKFQEQNRMEVHKNFLSPYVAALSHNIAQLLPEDLDISYFCNSGAEAVEGAVKLAYKYHGGKRKHILHADISFHGKLLGSAGLTGSSELTFDFPTIPGIGSFTYGSIDSVKDAIDNYRSASGKSDIYAIILEPFNATTLRGCTTDFLRELRDICTENNIVLIFDEVYSCWAKTGELFHFMGHQVVPDIVTMAKSMGGGKASISGYTTRKPFFLKAYGSLHHSIIHSTTYNGFGEETITAIEAINITVEDDYVGRSKRIFNQLNGGLQKLQEKYPEFISEVRGSGALNGIILNDSLIPGLRKALSFVPIELFNDDRFLAKLLTAAVISELYNEHSILTFYGVNREIPLILSPALIAEEKDIELLLHALDQTLSIGRLKLMLKFARFKFNK